MSNEDKNDLKGSNLFEQLQGLIQVVDQLRDVGLNNYISLPRIVVVGTQSSGKSSALESVVGLDFLPRGDGVVTRRPLELRLKTLPPTADGKDQAYAVFDQVDKTKRYTDFIQVREQIDKLTDEVAGVKKGIIDNPIVINVFATGCPNLTLIDLPGITRVAMAGTDQHEDIEAVTREMAMRYIKDPLTIILAVLPANQDMSTSDALQLARKVDPQGLRTIGVLTKIDIMDPGTDACKMLKGEDIPLRLGYVGLKMRSKADINAGMLVKEGMKKEREFFESHPRYSKLAKGYVGTDALTDKCSKVFLRHLRRFLPEIKREIHERKRNTAEALEKLGTGVPEDVNQQVQLMWTMITDFCDMFRNTISGKYDRKLQAYYSGRDESSVSGGAQIRQIFNDYMIEFDGESITGTMTEEDIEEAIRTHEGDSLPGFPSPDTFEFLILPHLKKINAPSIDVVNNIAHTLETLAQRIARVVFHRFPKLAEEVLMRAQEIMNREKEFTRDLVEKIVDSETGYMFTNDDGYLADHASMEPMYRQAEKKAAESAAAAAAAEPQAPPPPPSQAEQFGKKAAEGVNFLKQSAGAFHSDVFGQQARPGAAAQRRNKQSRYAGPFVEEMRRRLDSYFLLIVRNCRDAVPKAVGFFLVRQIQEKMQFELITALNNSELFSKLFGEPDEVVEERKRLRQELDTMENALTLLNRDPNLVKMQMSSIEDDMPPLGHQPPATHGRGAPGGHGHGGHGHGPTGGMRQAPAPAPARTAPGAPAPAPYRSGAPGPGNFAQPRPAAPSPRPAAGGGLFDSGPAPPSAVRKPPAAHNPLFD